MKCKDILLSTFVNTTNIVIEFLKDNQRPIILIYLDDIV